jgi:hypothetical protein
MTNSANSDHSDSSGFVAGLAVGLVLGAGSAYYLNSTKQGKELLEQLKLRAGDAINSVKDNPLLSDKIAELQKTMDQARATINDAAEKVVEATEPAKPAPKKNFFQRMGASLGK